MKLRTLGILAAVVLGASLSTTRAKAASIEITGGPVVTPIVSGPNAGDFSWAYTLTLTATNSIVPGGTAGLSSANNLVDGSNGSVVVFYEVGGYVSAAASNISWNTVDALTPPAPSPLDSDNVDVSPNHDGPGTNVAFIYTGSEFTAATDTSEGTFTIISTEGLNQESVLDYDARYVSLLTPALTTSENSDTPLGPTALPVPAAVWTGMTSLLAVAGLSLLRRRRLA